LTSINPLQGMVAKPPMAVPANAAKADMYAGSILDLDQSFARNGRHRLIGVNGERRAARAKQDCPE
jgi:hypothetical protein